jgi:hypothetical protein
MSQVSARIEALAALHNRSPLDLLEWFLERSAERLALVDIESELEGRS